MTVYAGHGNARCRRFCGELPAFIASGRCDKEPVTIREMTW